MKIYAILLIEYLSCDNNIPAGELITDEEIIEVVLEENDEQDESNANEEADIRPTISLPEAFTGTIFALFNRAGDSIRRHCCTL